MRRIIIEREKSRTSFYKLIHNQWDHKKTERGIVCIKFSFQNSESVVPNKDIIPFLRTEVHRIIYFATVKRRCVPERQKVNLHTCKQGLQLPPLWSQTEQEPAFSHSSQRLCSWQWFHAPAEDLQSRLQ